MATLYISPTGDDSTGDGSTTTPWLTINKAFTDSTTGDTIKMKDGTYEPETLTAPDKTLTLEAENDYLAIISHASTSQTWTFGTTNLTMNGIIWKEIVSSGSTPQFIFTGASKLPTIEFNRCKFIDIETINGASTQYNALFGQSGSTGIEITLTFNNCLLSNIYGDNSGAGTYRYLFTAYAAPAVIAITLTGCSIYQPSSSYDYTSIFSFWSSTGVLTIKNTIISCGDSTALIQRDPASSLVTYSDLHNVTGGTRGDGVITTDPLFVDPDGENLELQLDSPCISSGTLI